jgi:hypothetical protein
MLASLHTHCQTQGHKFFHTFSYEFLDFILLHFFAHGCLQFVEENILTPVFRMRGESSRRKRESFWARERSRHLVLKNKAGISASK